MEILKYLFFPLTILVTTLYGTDTDELADGVESVAQSTTQPPMVLAGNAGVGNKTFLISYPENCKVIAVNISNNDMRANVECDGESKVHKWDVNAVGQTVATAPLFHDGLVGITIFNSSNFDWSTDTEH